MEDEAHKLSLQTRELLDFLSGQTSGFKPRTEEEEDAEVNEEQRHSRGKVIIATRMTSEAMPC